MTVYHVVPAAGNWQLKKQTNKKVLSNHRKKSAAVNAAKRKQGRGDSVVIHRADGTVQKSI